jgi:hypothetical protein
MIGGIEIARARRLPLVIPMPRDPRLLRVVPRSRSRATPELPERPSWRQRAQRRHMLPKRGAQTVGRYGSYRSCQRRTHLSECHGRQLIEKQRAAPTLEGPG